MPEVSKDIQTLEARFADKILASEIFRGDTVVTVDSGSLIEIVRFLKEDSEMAFEFLADITVVDFLGKKTPRFHVVYHFNSPKRRCRLRVKVPLAESDPTVPSLTRFWRGANFLEREAWDMFGIRFEGHPDLRRILLYDAFEGHPLRKDYPVSLRQPLVPEREVEGTFVDERSNVRLAELKKKYGVGTKAKAE